MSKIKSTLKHWLGGSLSFMCTCAVQLHSAVHQVRVGITYFTAQYSQPTGTQVIGSMAQSFYKISSESNLKRPLAVCSAPLNRQPLLDSPSTWSQALQIIMALQIVNDLPSCTQHRNRTRSVVLSKKQLSKSCIRATDCCSCITLCDYAVNNLL